MAKAKIAPWMKRVPNNGCSGGNSQRNRDREREAQSRDPAASASPPGHGNNALRRLATSSVSTDK